MNENFDKPSTMEGGATTENVEYFVLPASLSISEWLGRISEQATDLPEAMAQLATTFGATLTRINKAALLPYRMAWLGVLDVHQQAFHQQATILALDQLDPLKDDLNSAVPPLRNTIAHAKFVELLGSDEGRDAAHRGAVEKLHRSAGLDKGALLRGAQDLLLQSVISVWAALETFVSDFIRAYLNRRPDALNLLLADEDAKKRIGRAKWTLSELMDIGLDLSGRAGDMVLSENDLSDLVSIKAVLLPLLGRPIGLTAALNNSELFTLGKLRNLLAHRGGTVDARFEKETDGRWPVGATVTIYARDLQKYVEATASVVEQILTAMHPSS
ncbi:hypothetical protein LFL96_13620 [Paraburkholderia sp. D15]|uniref:hypothetical protein n=1 Tax=Paraburkholderia sp. D15 TaxID=2880218 RepID=UPI00247A39F7|nr:hypothetical protein [Paraburkholderia sp. D15]WGS48812.1 hypothetical protein LFL96_13620 [Paraburkholderia sp. D15]